MRYICEVDEDRKRAGWRMGHRYLQDRNGAGTAFGADRTEQIGRLGPLIVGSAGREPFLAQR